MKNRGNEIHVERTKTVTKEKAMSTPIIHGVPYRSEHSRAFGAHSVVQQQVAAIYARKSTEQTGMTRAAFYGRYSSEGQRLAKGTTLWKCSMPAGGERQII